VTKLMAYANAVTWDRHSGQVQADPSNHNNSSA
jgi:hypothetical protein